MREGWWLCLLKPRATSRLVERQQRIIELLDGQSTAWRYELNWCLAELAELHRALAAARADLAGVAIAAALAQAPPGARLYAGAADRDQARLFADSIQGFQARTPELRGALDVQAYRVLARRSGAVLEILAADAPGAWGLRPW